MSIWEHTSVGGSIGEANRKSCVFCKRTLRLLKETMEREGESRKFVHDDIDVCDRCGWWRVRRFENWDNAAMWEQTTYCVSARLKQLDLADISVPIQEVRDYLCVAPEARFTVDPKKFEDVVGSVFKDLGYFARVTAYSGDDGLDVILEKGSSSIGVQVKRYGDSIEVEQIRSLVGALVLHDLTRGIFVTTSTFQSGAPRTVAKYAQRGFAIEVMDADRFLLELGIAQRAAFERREEIPESLWRSAMAQADRVESRSGDKGFGMWVPMDGA